MRPNIDIIPHPPAFYQLQKNQKIIKIEKYGIDILKALQLRPVPPDEVNLIPQLIHFNN